MVAVDLLRVSEGFLYIKRHLRLQGKPGTSLYGVMPFAAGQYASQALQIFSRGAQGDSNEICEMLNNNICIKCSIWIRGWHMAVKPRRNYLHAGRDICYRTRFIRSVRHRANVDSLICGPQRRVLQNGSCQEDCRSIWSLIVLIFHMEQLASETRRQVSWRSHTSIKSEEHFISLKYKCARNFF